MPTRWSDSLERAVEVGVWQVPVAVTQEQRDAARKAIVPYERYLEPAPGRWLKVRIATLLAHYFVPDMSAALQGEVASDWLTLLGKYPAHAVEQACMEWLSGGMARRPTPGEILLVCDRLIGKVKRERDRLVALSKLPVATVTPAGRSDPSGPRELPPDVQARLDEVRKTLSRAKPRGNPLGEERGNEPLRPLPPFRLADDDDPAVQETLRRMREA